MYINVVIMKNFLIPTDFSSTADHAVQLAMELAQNTKATIHLLHTVEYNYAGPMAIDGTFIAHDHERSAIDRMLKKADDKLTEYIQSLPLDGLSIQKKLGLGKPDEVVIQHIAELDIDLVVMGSHGASGLVELFIGSNAGKVIRNATCPVITVKQATNLADIKKIVFASDLIEPYTPIVEQVKQLQVVFNAALFIVRVNTPQNFERDAVIKPLKDKMLKKFGVNSVDIQTYNDHTLEDGIRHYADEINADMIALATHGRRGLAHLVTGSIAQDLVNHTSKPVWSSHF
jgi:nucleotide-binding universal stress UspA family protein